MNLRNLIIAAFLVPRPLILAAEPAAVIISGQRPVLFPDSLNGPVYDFIELYAAEAAAGIPADRSLEEKLLQDGVTAEGGSIRDLPSIVAAKGPLTAQSGKPLSVTVSTRLDRHYRVEWRDTAGMRVYAIAFPIDHLLLHRLTPATRESLLLSALRRLTRPDIPPSLSIPPSAPSNHSLSPSADSLPPVTIPGDSLFTSKINNNLYLSADSLPLVAPSLYPVETLSNILTTADIPNDIILDLSYTLLDGAKARFHIPLNPLLRYFRDEGCSLFFGISQARPGSPYTGLLLARDAAQGYCHALRLCIGPDNLEILSGSAEARLTAYIPLSRVLSLFDENDQ